MNSNPVLTLMLMPSYSGALSGVFQASYWILLIYFTESSHSQDRERSFSTLLFKRCFHEGLLLLACLFFSLLAYMLHKITQQFQRKKYQHDGEFYRYHSFTAPPSQSQSLDEKRMLIQDLQSLHRKTSLSRSRKHEAEDSPMEFTKHDHSSKAEGLLFDNFSNLSQARETKMSLDNELLARRDKVMEDRHCCKINYTFWAIVMLSVLLNVISQLLLVFAIDLQLYYSLPHSHSFLHKLACLASVLLYQILLLPWSFISFFIVEDQTRTDEEYNTTTGVYFIMLNMVLVVPLGILICPEISISLISATAFFIQGARLFLLRVLLKDSSPKKKEVYICDWVQLTTAHFWVELLIFALIALWYLPLIISKSHTLVKNLTVDIPLSLLYPLWLAFTHQGLFAQSLFHFTNQLIFLVPILCLSIVLKSLFSWTTLFLIFLTLGTLYFALLGLQCLCNFCAELKEEERREAGYKRGAYKESGVFDDSKYERLLNRDEDTWPDGTVHSLHFEYYIVENDVSLLLKKRPCLDDHYKRLSIQHFSLRFYQIQSFEFGEGPDGRYLTQEEEQRRFFKVIERYQRMQTAR